jgi:cathepsin A (carboxypeptidase C)
MSGASIATPILPDFNMYDIREPCVEAGLCYPDDHMFQIMNSKPYRQAFNIPAKEGWEMCAGTPHMGLMFDLDKMYGYKLAPLLDDGVPILIYNGDKDYICNWVGGLTWLEALEWTGRKQFKKDLMK